MQADLSPAEYQQTIHHELGMDEPLWLTRAGQWWAEVGRLTGVTTDELAAGLSRGITGYCCKAGQVCAPDPCPWHQMGDSDAT